MSEFTNPLLTAWGYIADTASMADLLTAQEFSNYTAGKFGSDTRITANIPAASSSIRNFCGWHISPSLTCGMLYRVADLRDYFVGPDLLIQLPATFISSVSKIVVDAKLNELTQEYEGDIMTDYDLTTSGLLRIYDVGIRDRKSQIFIKYTAGLSGDATPAIKELAANMVTHAVTSSYGVNSETAGGVSVSYSSTWAGQSGSTALTNDTRDTLDAYKVKGVY